MSIATFAASFFLSELSEALIFRPQHLVLCWVSMPRFLAMALLSMSVHVALEIHRLAFISLDGGFSHSFYNSSKMVSVSKRGPTLHSRMGNVCRRRRYAFSLLFLPAYNVAMIAR